MIGANREMESTLFFNGHKYSAKYLFLQDIVALCAIPMAAHAVLMCLSWTAVASSAPENFLEQFVPEGLQVNFMASPLGVDRPRSVHFSWRLPSVRSTAQISTVQVLLDEIILGSNSTRRPVWDSGQVTTNRPELVANLISVLRSDRKYSWVVRVWTDVGNNVGLPPMSQPATFTTGLLGQTDWSAKWIRKSGGGGGQCRKDFVVEHAVHRVSLFVAACQYYTLFLDGKVIGTQALDGPWTSFYTNRSYTTHDIDPGG